MAAKILCIEGVNIVRETNRKRVFSQNGSTSVACLSYTIRNEGTSSIIIDNDITLCAGTALGFGSDALPTYRDDKIVFRFDGTGVTSPFNKLVLIETYIDHPNFIQIQKA